MLFKIIPLGALASTYTRQDGGVLTGDTGITPAPQPSPPPPGRRAQRAGVTAPAHISSLQTKGGHIVWDGQNAAPKSVRSQSCALPALYPVTHLRGFCYGVILATFLLLASEENAERDLC